jgi:hypothetical protein
MPGPPRAGSPMARALQTCGRANILRAAVRPAQAAPQSNQAHINVGQINFGQISVDHSCLVFQPNAGAHAIQRCARPAPP